MSQTTLSIFLHAFSFSFGMFLIARYRLWKAGRSSIPMEYNPKTGMYEADLTLRKWERRAKIALWVFIASAFAVGVPLFLSFDPALVAK
ncbi:MULTISPECIES: hypothetical protein [unclassified Sphingobium]|uniref:hypothetical protein n=1 Tax=unclassified Sphingobium TaxID=2611147 RepID=UPI0005CBAAAC|nr:MULTISPECIES: hypothetical protein [unclassified Sphingobium]AJR22530.1 hypothetical protein TZ53_00740 [Sphingobium sp. YBL2]UXC89526.1 hypothetical protein EGM87_10590 [Sphingobium sp. RSMS]